MQRLESCGSAMRSIAISILVAAFSIACSPVETVPNPPDYWPTNAWLSANPGEHGFDGDRLDKVDELVKDELPFLDSLLVIRDGNIVFERYFNGYDEQTLHDQASVTKSWTSAAVGVARSQGELIELNTKLPELLPEEFGSGSYEDKRSISLEHLLEMRSGIEFDDELFSVGGYGDEELLEGDVTEFVLGFPVAHPPDEVWNYSTLDTQLISALVEQAVGVSLSSFVEEQLFEPMGILEYEWSQDATGTAIGGSGLKLRPRDMAKLGFQYLHGGQWDGEQLVPAEWVQESTTPQNSSAYYAPSDQVEVIEWYGYHWWTWKPEWFHGYRGFNAKGYGGQEVLVLPELDLIIVTTAKSENITPDTAGEQEAEIYALFYDVLLPALEEIEP